MISIRVNINMRNKAKKKNKNLNQANHYILLKENDIISFWNKKPKNKFLL